MAARPAAMPRRRVALLLAAAGALGLALGGCLPPQADFEWGVGTRRVTGYMNVTADDTAGGGPIIVVYKYHHKFVALDDRPAVVHPTAHVVRVGRAGEFAIDMPADVVSMDVLFIAPDRLTDTFHFERQLGVGAVTYRANLEPMDDWRQHYYTFLSPQLQHLIVEERYRLPPPDQQALAAWLSVQNERLAARGPRRERSE